MSSINPVELAAALIQRPSVTPADAGALDVLQAALEPLGFQTTRLKFGDIENLYAEIGSGTPHFCFAGHTDVVPPGDESAWAVAPFSGEVRDGQLWGRGAADMKAAIAAFAAASAQHLAQDSQEGTNKGRISLLITGDEEGPAINGTKKMLAWLEEQKIKIDHCLVGEPSNPEELGEMVKVGRRGSINCWLTVTGRQGHVAYPDRAENPIPVLLRKLLVLNDTPLDEGYPRFQPSNLEITDIEIGNPAHNVIPNKAKARFNVRFNPTWTGPRIEAWLRETIDNAASGLNVETALECIVSGEAFLTTDDAFLALIGDCVEEKTKRRPELSTSGGTSDARFIKDYAPVAEFGLIGATMHKIDEHVSVTDIEQLADIYALILERYFATFSGGGREAL